ncbi:tyrosine-type recombinase/integrase [Candidatus Borrarchaeum sp.]|uniref:tyrosine-type recombinase/integrase n=1 Tax=Candidatus Borrarchaeum sp. TaxID=2846742 RepID=UPI00257C780F|nr:tyrosine-type recombinase/integrase [Candidatus Borrarchaeum sp.]
MSKILTRSKRKSYDWFLNFKSVTEWIVDTNKESTQRERITNLSHFCKKTNTTPQTLLDQTPEEISVLFDRTFKELKETLRDRSFWKMRAAVNNFLRYHNKKIEKPLGERQDEYGRFVKIPMTEKVYGWLLDYDEINLWINDYKSTGTRDGYLSCMNYFLDHSKLKPPDLLSLSPEEIIKKYTLVKQKYIKEGKNETARKIYIVLRSFFDYHRRRIPFTKRDKVKRTAKRTRIQQIPQKEEIYRMADSAGSLRNRALILCLFQSGVRSNCIRRWTYGMIKAFVEPKLTVPIHLKITSDIDTKLINYQLTYYYTFLQDEAAEALKTYIEWRKETEGWKPKDDDIVFASESYRENGRPLYHDSVNRIVKRSAKKIGLDPDRIWAHLLRKSFRKMFYKAPIDNDLAEALMGHKLEGSKENYFDRHDLGWIASEYMKAPFSREGVGRLNQIEKEIREKDKAIKNLEERITKMERILDISKKL